MGTDICLRSEANNLGLERYVTKNYFTLQLFELTYSKLLIAHRFKYASAVLCQIRHDVNKDCS
jgi:hypothetical protein